MEEPILELRGVSKYFPGIHALEGVDFRVRRSEVHALIGENGAGKSTLVKILSGVYQPTEGIIIRNGEEIELKNPHFAQAAGISTIHQEATMFPDLTVTENIFMGHHARGARSGVLDWRSMERRTLELLEQLEIDIDPKAVVKNLSVAERQMIEIVKALSINASVVIMDEPTSALTLKEVDHLYKIIRRLKEQGKAIIFISHKFDEIFNIADYYTVLRDGQYVGEGRVADTKVDDLIRMMVGRTLNQLFPKADVEQGEVVLSAEGLTSEGIFNDISFELHKGEILGFFGLVGAGRSEVMRALFGIDPLTAGQVALEGTAVRIKNPRDALELGIGLVPEDRQLQGAIVEMSINDNTTLAVLSSLSPRGFLDKRKQLEVTDKFGTLMQIKASGWNQQVNNLSGGNQQKVVLAKWLAADPKILILDEPTKGIDVGTKAAVHKLISELAGQGMGIILVSSELPEILGMADSVIVMHEGVQTARFERAECNSEKIMMAATGQHNKG